MERIELIPKPGEEVCDFCSSPHPTWTMPARSDNIDATIAHGKTMIRRTEGAWAACDDCAALIQNGDRKGLLERSLNLFTERYPELPLGLVAVFIGSTHEAFWHLRTGAGFRGQDHDGPTQETVTQN